MQPDEKKRTLSSDRYKFLFEELERLRQAGAIDADAIEAARRFYGDKHNLSALDSIFATLIALGVATLLVFAYLFFQAYWLQLFQAYKPYFLATPFLVSCVALTALTHCGQKKGSKLGLFIAAATFLISVVNVSDYAATFIPPLHSRVAVIMTLSAVATSALAFFKKESSLHYLTCAFIGAGLCCYLDSIVHNASLIPYELLVLFALLAAGLHWGFYRAQKNVGEVYMVLTIGWAMLMYSYYADDWLQIWTAPFLMSVILLLLEILRKLRYRLFVSRNLALIMQFGFLVALSFERPDEYSLGHCEHFVLNHAVQLALLGLCAFETWALYMLDARQKRAAGEERRPFAFSVKTLARYAFSPEAVSVLLTPVAIVYEYRIESCLTLAFYYVNILTGCVLVNTIVFAKTRSADLKIGRLAFLVWLLPRSVAFALGNDFFEWILLAIMMVTFGAAYFVRKAAKRSKAEAENAESQPQIVELTRDPVEVVPARVARYGVHVTLGAMIVFSIFAIFLAFTYK